MAGEYLIWNATVASLQFWTADLNQVSLSTATKEEVYSAFFYTTSTYTLCQQSEEILFCQFVTTLNAAFEQKLAMEDKGYESSSENYNMPTLLRKMPKIHHISSIVNSSFDPNLVMHKPPSMVQSHSRSVHRWLTYSSSDDSDTSEDTLPVPRATPTDA